MAYDEFTAKMVRKCSELEQALAEKDEEIAYLNMRVDALRRWLSKKISTMEAKDAAYQQLMEKAVRWASYITTIHGKTWEAYKDAEMFLDSPEVQAWKEVKP